MASVALSFVHPWGDPGKAGAAGGAFLSGAQIPDNVKRVITEKCIDCHSEQPRLPVYSRLAPFSWLVEYDIASASARWNISRWERYTAIEKGELLSRLGVRAKLGSMPPARYSLLHPDSKLTGDESRS